MCICMPVSGQRYEIHTWCVSINAPGLILTVAAGVVLQLVCVFGILSLEPASSGTKANSSSGALNKV